MDAAAAQLRTWREFTEVYNKIVHRCFDQCISSFYHARASEDEIYCVDHCMQKNINFNQRHMFSFVEHQELKQKRLAAEAEAQMQKATPATALPEQGAATPQALSTSPEQSTTPQALSVENPTAGGAVPHNVCHNLGAQPAVQLATFPEKFTLYTGKAIVDQFLDRGSAQSERI